jgi:hypothetical protein
LYLALPSKLSRGTDDDYHDDYCDNDDYYYDDYHDIIVELCLTQALGLFFVSRAILHECMRFDGSEWKYEANSKQWVDESKVKTQ